MDTIIYVYPQKEYGKSREYGRIGEYRSSEENKRQYHRQDYDMGDYHLVRVGVSSELWRILRKQGQEEQGDEAQMRTKQAGAEQVSGSSEARKHFVLPWRKKHLQRLAEKRRAQQLLEEEKCRQDFVQALLVDREHSYFVTEEPISFLEGWSFRGYLEENWVMHVMQHATLNHFLILGKAECIPRLMLQYVRKMKSLKWVLPKRQFGEAEQELVEELYEEYGLATEVRLLECEKDYRRMPLICKVPTVLVDFCEEERIPAADVAKGSIWLDMTASEEKRRRLESRNMGITYFSLKKEWKEPQNAPYQLDTIGKNGYNT